MKLLHTLGAAGIFLFTFTAVSQQPFDGPGEMGPGDRQRKSDNAEVLYPYKRPVRVKIDADTNKLSFQRTAQIEKLVEKYFLLNAADRGKYVKAQSGSERLQFDDVQIKEIRESLEEEIIRTVFKGGSLVPKGKPLPCDRTAMQQQVEPEVLLKFPLSEDAMKKKFKAEAVKKFPFAKKGSKVTIVYRSGRHSYSITGIYYGSGVAGQSILINSKSIPIRDIDQKQITLFNKSANAEARRKYEEEKTAKYNKEKFKYSQSLVDRGIKQERQTNEQNRFIYFRKSNTKENEVTFIWATPKEVIDDISAPIIAVTAKRIAYEADIEAKRAAEARRLAEERKRAENSGDGGRNSADGNPNAPKPGAVDF